MTIPDKFVQTNNIRLHYLDHPGGDPPLVLLPGLTANAHAFDGLIEAGLSPQLRVLALDLRGRGLSHKPETGYSMAEHAADVIGLLDALGLDQVVLGGHSFGGLLAVYIAVHYPARVSKVIIIDAARETAHPRTKELIKPSLARLDQVLPSVKIYLEQMKQMPFLGGQWDAAIERYFRADLQENDDGTAQARSPAKAIEEAMDKAIAEPWDEHLAAVRQPAILLHAAGPYVPPDGPPIVPKAEAEATVQQLPNCRYVEVPGNHITLLFGQNAQQVVGTMTAFVREDE